MGKFDPHDVFDAGNRGIDPHREGARRGILLIVLDQEVDRRAEKQPSTEMIETGPRAGRAPRDGVDQEKRKRDRPAIIVFCFGADPARLAFGRRCNSLIDAPRCYGRLVAERP